MKKPIKQQSVKPIKFDLTKYYESLENIETNYDLGLSCFISPENLRKMAGDIEKSNATHFAVGSGWDHSENLVVKLETEEESENRYKENMKKYRKSQKAKEEVAKKKLIKDAEKLGLKISE